jgi:hypothetical protein
VTVQLLSPAISGCRVRDNPPLFIVNFYTIKFANRQFRFQWLDVVDSTHWEYVQERYEGTLMGVIALLSGMNDLVREARARDRIGGLYHDQTDLDRLMLDMCWAAGLEGVR